MMDGYHPDAVVDWSEGDSSTRRLGAVGSRSGTTTTIYSSSGPGVRMDPVEVIQAGEDRFVVVVRLWGQSKPSGIQVEQQFGMLYTIRDEKVFRLTVYRQTRNRPSRQPLRTSSRVLPSAKRRRLGSLDQLDPVAVRVTHEAQARSALAHAVGRLLGLDALARELLERRVEVVGADRDVAVGRPEVVRVHAVL